MKKPNDPNPDRNGGTETNQPAASNETVLDKTISPDVRRARRRSLLKSISSVGALSASQLPQQWARPIVDQVLLPVHASGSPYCAVTCTVNAELIPEIAVGTTSVEVADCSIGTLPCTTASQSTTVYFVTMNLTATMTCARSPDNQIGSTSTNATNSFTVTDSGTVASSNIFSTFSTEGVAPSLCQVPITELISNGPPVLVPI